MGSGVPRCHSIASAARALRRARYSGSTAPGWLSLRCTVTSPSPERVTGAYSWASSNIAASGFPQVRFTPSARSASPGTSGTTRSHVGHRHGELHGRPGGAPLHAQTLREGTDEVEPAAPEPRMCRWWSPAAEVGHLDVDRAAVDASGQGERELPLLVGTVGVLDGVGGGFAEGELQV